MKTVLTILGAATLMAVAPAAAAETIAVPYGDLDLSTAKGQARLASRVEHAIRDVCQLNRRISGSRLTDPEAVACAKLARLQSRAQLAAIMESSAKGG